MHRARVRLIRGAWRRRCGCSMAFVSSGRRRRRAHGMPVVARGWFRGILGRRHGLRFSFASQRQDGGRNGSLRAILVGGADRREARRGRGRGTTRQQESGQDGACDLGLHGFPPFEECRRTDSAWIAAAGARSSRRPRAPAAGALAGAQILRMRDGKAGGEPDRRCRGTQGCSRAGPATMAWVVVRRGIVRTKEGSACGMADSAAAAVRHGQVQASELAQCPESAWPQWPPVAPTVVLSSQGHGTPSAPAKTKSSIRVAARHPRVLMTHSG